MNTKLLEAIYESALDGEITAEQCQAMEDILMQEKVFSNPIRKFKDFVAKIRKEKPDEYTGSEDVKKYIDKNYDEMMKIAEILEDEPGSLRKDEVTTLIGGISIVLGGVLLSSVASVPGLVVTLVGYLGMIVATICQYIRINDDQATYNNFIKIRESLEKVSKSSKVDDDIKKKIKSMVSKIDDVETEFNSGGLKMNITK